MAMTVIGFIPGLDVVSDAYFLGRAIVDVIQGRGSWADVAMNAAFLLAPAVGGAYFRAAKTALNALDGAADAARSVNKAENLVDAAKAIRKTDNVGDVAKGAANRLPDDALVVRGGLNQVEDLRRGLGVDEGILGVSVQSAAGKKVDELAAFIPNKKMGVTTVGQIRAKGGDVIPTPSSGPGYHCTVKCGPGGISLEDLSELLQPPIPNPRYG